LNTDQAVIPPVSNLFDNPPSRYGRFDTYTKLGCAAVALALSDAELSDSSEKRPIGIVTSSSWECTSVDMDYYETTLSGDGALASPNHFSYTLPCAMHGECATHFRLTGPTVCVGEDAGLGHAALGAALLLIAAGAATVMIAGWLDAPPRECDLECDDSGIVGGAIFVILENSPRPSPMPVCWIRYSRGEIRSDFGDPVISMLDLFGERHAGCARE